MPYFFGNCKVEISSNGTTWTAISSSTAAVEVDGGEREIGSVTPFGQDYPDIVAGTRKELKVKLKLIYDEQTSGAFEILRGNYEQGTTTYVRWSPRGGTTGQFQYTTSAGYISSFSYPSGESGSEEPILCEVEVVVPRITKSVVT